MLSEIVTTRGSLGTTFSSVILPTIFDKKVERIAIYLPPYLIIGSVNVATRNYFFLVDREINEKVN
jgi:hypothetical protein